MQPKIPSEMMVFFLFKYEIIHREISYFTMFYKSTTNKTAKAYQY